VRAREQPAAAATRWARARGALTPAEWRRAAGMAAVVVALHVAGLLVLLLVVAPHRHAGGAAPAAFGVGLGLTAYVLGLRHAFDADHVAAIDNVTRKLTADGRRPLGVGFCFSLGHATVVLALALLLAAGVRGLGGQVARSDTTLHAATGLVGPLVSGAFLLLIGLLNRAVLASVVRSYRRLRRGELDERELERELVGAAGGALARLYGRATRAVGASWQAYPLGLLFGLGFDTASEVGLLVLAGGAALGGLPFWAILCLPLLFAAGMSLLDTLDGVVMRFAYGWAFERPVRRLYYNATVTGLSVAVALLVGTVELLGVLADRLGLDGGAWSLLAAVDLTVVGYAVVGLFALTWAGALLLWRFGRVEERWSAGLRR
jgi:nickel/cobalt transporter (NiCoT) family protein